MNTAQSLSSDEKDALLEPIPSPHGRINGKDLILALLIFIAIFFIFAPKIYYSGEVYRLSRDIAKINRHLELLKEENKKYRQELENLRFEQDLRMES